ncbi:unnamed protein product, partial [Didymodactylos carnosus]
MASLNPKIQVVPQTVLFTQPINNNLTINNLGNTTQNIRQSISQNATVGINSNLISSSPNIVRIPSSSIQQPQQIPSAIWSSIQNPFHPQQQQNGVIQPSAQIQAVQLQGIQRIFVYNIEPIQYTPGTLQTVLTQRPQTIGTSNLALASNNQHQLWSSSTTITSPASVSSSSAIMVPTTLITTTKPSQVIQQQKLQPQQTTFTESQVIDFVSKCRTFLTTLLKLAEKQAPDKLPMVKQCIQELLEGTIGPETFTDRLHTLYKSQPHMSLVPFFK